MKRAIALTVVAATSILATDPSAGANPTGGGPGPRGPGGQTSEETPTPEPTETPEPGCTEHDRGGGYEPVTVCNIRAGGDFTAKVEADPLNFPTQTVIWYGKLEDSGLWEMFRTLWVPLYSETEYNSDGVFEPSLKYSLQDFKAWSSAYGIGWTKIGVCMHPHEPSELTTVEDRNEGTSFCAPSIEVPELNSENLSGS